MWPDVRESLSKQLEAKAIKLYDEQEQHFDVIFEKNRKTTEDEKEHARKHIEKAPILEQYEEDAATAIESLSKNPSIEAELKLRIVVFDVCCFLEKLRCITRAKFLAAKHPDDVIQSIEMQNIERQKNLIVNLSSFIKNKTQPGYYHGFMSLNDVFKYMSDYIRREIDMYKYVVFYQYSEHKEWRDAIVKQILYNSSKEQLSDHSYLYKQLENIKQKTIVCKNVSHREEKSYLNTLLELFISVLSFLLRVLLSLFLGNGLLRQEDPEHKIRFEQKIRDLEEINSKQKAIIQAQKRELEKEQKEYEDIQKEKEEVKAQNTPVEDLLGPLEVDKYDQYAELSTVIKSLESGNLAKMLQENEMLAAAEKRKLEQKHRGMKRRTVKT